MYVDFISGLITLSVNSTDFTNSFGSLKVVLMLQRKVPIPKPAYTVVTERRVHFQVNGRETFCADIL